MGSIIHDTLKSQKGKGAAHSELYGRCAVNCVKTGEPILTIYTSDVFPRKDVTYGETRHRRIDRQDRFTRFYTAHGRASLYFRMDRSFSLPLPMGDLNPHLIHDSLGPPESSTRCVKVVEDVVRKFVFAVSCPDEFPALKSNGD